MDDELLNKHRAFFGPFFSDRVELDRFILERAEYSTKDSPSFQSSEELFSYIKENEDYPINNVPLIMMNNVMRLITLADEMDKVRPGRKSLSIFFTIVCIESLYKFMPDPPNQLQERPIRFFNDYISPEDKRLIVEGISISSISTKEELQITPVTITQFALMLYNIRSNVAHQGIYWNFAFPSEEDRGMSILNNIMSKINKDEAPKEVVYSVSITYERFREVCVKTFIHLLNKEFERVKNTGF